VSESTQGEQPDPRLIHGSVPDVLAIIESAKVRGGLDYLERFIAKALPDVDDAEVQEAAQVALEVIESVPIFLARARQEADARGLTSVVYPVLRHAEQYYVQPMDLIPEMTRGLPGLLDDSYLVLRIIQNLDKGPQEFLDWDLEDPCRFLSRLMGPAISKKLDLIAEQAMEEVSTQLADLWQKMAHHA
jgi:hypothetical protein